MGRAWLGGWGGGESKGRASGTRGRAEPRRVEPCKAADEPGGDRHGSPGREGLRPAGEGASWREETGRKRSAEGQEKGPKTGAPLGVGLGWGCGEEGTERPQSHGKRRWGLRSRERGRGPAGPVARRGEGFRGRTQARFPKGLGPTHRVRVPIVARSQRRPRRHLLWSPRREGDKGRPGGGGGDPGVPFFPSPPSRPGDASSKKLGAVDARVLAERASERARAGRGRGGDTEGPSGPVQGDPGAPSGRRASGRVHGRGPGRGRGAGPGRRQREATKGPGRKGRQGEGREGRGPWRPRPRCRLLKVQVRAGSRVLGAEAGLGAPLSSKFSQENRE